MPYGLTVRASYAVIYFNGCAARRVCGQDPGGLKALSHPLRSRIIFSLGEPQTVEELAGRLSVDALKMYYHVKLLQKHGLIEIAATTKRGRLEERVYRLTADGFGSTRGSSKAAHASRPSPASSRGRFATRLRSAQTQTCERKAGAARGRDSAHAPHPARPDSRDRRGHRRPARAIRHIAQRQGFDLCFGHFGHHSN